MAVLERQLSKFAKCLDQDLEVRVEKGEWPLKCWGENIRGNGIVYLSNLQARALGVEDLVSTGLRVVVNSHESWIPNATSVPHLKYSSTRVTSAGKRWRSLKRVYQHSRGISAAKKPFGKACVGIYLRILPCHVGGRVEPLSRKPYLSPQSIRKVGFVIPGHLRRLTPKEDMPPWQTITEDLEALSGILMLLPRLDFWRTNLQLDHRAAE